MTDHVCTGPACLPCLDLVLSAGVLRDDEGAAVQIALDRTAEGLAILAEADAEISRAQAQGTDYFVQDPSRGWKTS